MCGHQQALVHLLRFGFPAGDGGADSPARGLALTTLAQSGEQRERDAAFRDYEFHKYQERVARLVRRDVRFGRTREEDLLEEDRERLRRLRSSELTVKRPDRPANLIERLCRFLGTTTVAPEDGATLRPL